MKSLECPLLRSNIVKQSAAKKRDLAGEGTSRIRLSGGVLAVFLAFGLGMGLSAGIATSTGTNSSERTAPTAHDAPKQELRAVVADL